MVRYHAIFLILLLILPFTSALGKAVSPPVSFYFCAAPDYSIAPLHGRSFHSVKEYGVKGDGVTDDTVAIQQAFDQVPIGSILSFPEGIYSFSKRLKLTRNDIILQSNKAVLTAKTPLHQTLELKGDRIAILGFTLKGSGNKRDTTPDSTKILISGGWVQVVGNTIEGGASAGIFVYGAHDFRIAGNSVSNTLADGIHTTGGSQRGLIEGNVVSNTGDDKIAVVSYGTDPTQIVSNILIRNNTVSGGQARGITVVGGKNIVIRGNTIDNIAGAGGILVAQELAYKTNGVNGVLIDNNTVSRIETSPLPDGKPYPRHGAIDVNTSDQNPVQFVEITNNHITQAGFAGIRVLGNACHIRIAGNNTSDVSRVSGEPPVAIENDNCPVSSIICEGNIHEGELFLARASQCTVSEEDRKTWPFFDFSSPEGQVWQGCK